MRQTEASPLLLRPSDAADVLGISRSKLYELIAERTIPTVQVGKRARVPLKALEAWVDQQVHEQVGARHARP